ncbi:sulfatase-like hydrolase/transferase [Stieleria maiorica]|uniref:sulfatase-like hydrolase/transferase n=1 Tax=Stieleria maiorica TaxID=2795974 RepID=UPI001F465259|nr:sulfatase-like hydrolase/transferase [Stieleria maiorica]
MQNILQTLVLLSAQLCLAGLLLASDRPNVIVIVSDDQGYGDVGFNGPCDIPTPNLDALAESGIVMEAGYASHPYCSPSRAGLLTGRYQQRFGHECNPGASEDDPTSGLPVGETMMSDVMKSAGYRTVAIGKWHLGDAKPFWPTERGFEEWFGFTGGGMSYWGTPKKGRPLGGVLKDGQPVDPSSLTYLTDDFSDAAIDFIDRHRESPFFMYLAYNAPHAPDQATADHLSKVDHIEYGGRAVYGAMVAGMDEGIGRVMNKLEQRGLKGNTLVVFYSDNGGRTTHASNLPLRGHKGMLFEGGIRVPFCVSWPDGLPGGVRYSAPVSALDIFPTVLAACQIDSDVTAKLDGVNLLPFLKGENESRPHETLFWRYAMDGDRYGYAVRDGDDKLVISQYKQKSLLFDLSQDPGERHDLAESNPGLVERLTGLIRDWDRQNMRPLWLDPHGANVAKEENARAEIVNRALPPKSKRSNRNGGQD